MIPEKYGTELDKNVEIMISEPKETKDGREYT